MPSKLFLAIIVVVAGCRLLALGACCALCCELAGDSGVEAVRDRRDMLD